MRNLFICLIIFSFKILENSLSTLRIIVVANGKKLLGAILQGIIALVWVFSTTLVVTNLKESPYKVIAFVLGSLIGSYIGSIIEEYIAMGDNLVTAIVNKNKSFDVVCALKKQGYNSIILNGKDYNKQTDILMIMVKRKKKGCVIKLIKNMDRSSIIIVENAYAMDNNYFNK